MNRWRHLLIAALTVPALCLYAVLCLFVADYVTGLHWLLDTLYYVLAGLAWLYPASHVVTWLARYES